MLHVCQLDIREIGASALHFTNFKLSLAMHVRANMDFVLITLNSISLTDLSDIFVVAGENRKISLPR